MNREGGTAIAHVFVDETKERGYFVAAAIVLPKDLAAARQAIRSLILPGQRRIHFSHESDPRRRKILDTIIDLDASAVIYDGASYPNKKRVRDACLIQLVEDLVTLNAERVVLELDDSVLRADRALLYRRVHAAGLRDKLQYDHMRAHEECLLTVPDAIAWCWAKGGHWRTKVQDLVTSVRKV